MKPEIDAALVLRAYVWALLKKNYPDVWHEDNYGGQVPIVPLGEEPELSQYSGPNIVYGYSLMTDDGPHSGGGMTMLVRDTSIRRIIKTINILKTALDRKDESATDVNEFSSTYELAGNNPFIGLRFGYIRAMFAESPDPPETEGGRASAIIDIEYQFYTDYDVITSVL